MSFHYKEGRTVAPQPCGAPFLEPIDSVWVFDVEINALWALGPRVHRNSSFLHLLSLPGGLPTGTWPPGEAREPPQSHALDPIGLIQSSRRLRFCSSPAAKAWLQH